MLLLINYIMVYYFIRRLQTVSSYRQEGYVLSGVCLSCCLPVWCTSEAPNEKEVIKFRKSFESLSEVCDLQMLVFVILREKC